MFCVKCGTSLPDDAIFCFKCGCDVRNLNQSTGTELFAVKVGGYVKFGSYLQNNGDVEEPIEWLVLEVRGNKALLVSRYGLDHRKYHHVSLNKTWEQCDLRKWLNEEFLKTAFSEDEQRRINLSEVVNDDNRKFGTSGGNNTQDWVFCLSLTEAERYFKNDGERMCKPTVHARNQGSWVDGTSNCWWWLRSPGADQNRASFVCGDGALGPVGLPVSDAHHAVRPALRLIWNLKSLGEIMFCMNCGIPLPDDANFCFKCGCDLSNLSQSAGTSYSSVKVGDYVKFGSYPQNDGNDKEPIEWLVLEVQGNEALLVSRYGLDCEQYHYYHEYEYVILTWERCELRHWLNSDFLKAAFSEDEQHRIKLSEVANDDNRHRGGNNTRDRVFCLSLTEAERYFKNDGERKCRPTAHARNQGAWVDNVTGLCYWWLRSPGLSQYHASNVRTDGALSPRGLLVYDDNGVVRPALWLILNPES